MNAGYYGMVWANCLHYSHLGWLIGNKESKVAKSGQNVCLACMVHRLSYYNLLSHVPLAIESTHHWTVLYIVLHAPGLRYQYDLRKCNFLYVLYIACARFTVLMVVVDIQLSSPTSVGLTQAHPTNTFTCSLVMKWVLWLLYVYSAPCTLHCPQAYSYNISKRGPSSRKETSNFTSLSDASFTQTQLHYESITNPSACMSYSSGSLTHQPVDEQSEFDQFSSDSAVDGHSRDELLLHTERSQAVGQKCQ